jgi:hypothetical protein
MKKEMKPQDVIFGLLFLFVLWRQKSQPAVFLGLSCLLLAMPLFQFWIFFTAERLVWYATAFLMYAVVLLSIREFHENRH